MMQISLDDFKRALCNLRLRVRDHYTDEMYQTGKCPCLIYDSLMASIDNVEKAADRFGVMPTA
jgi:hypothetical protein